MSDKFQLQFIILFWLAAIPTCVAILGLALQIFFDAWKHDVEVLERYLWSGQKPTRVIKRRRRVETVAPGFTAIIAGCAAVLFMLILTLMAIPFNAKYWVITYHSGVVATNTYTHGQIQIGGDDASTVYTITLDGDSNQYVITDNRLALYKTGSHVDLACTLQWNYGGKDELNCGLAGGDK